MLQLPPASVRAVATLAVVVLCVDCSQRDCTTAGYCRTFDLLDWCSRGGACTVANVDVMRFSSHMDDQSVQASGTLARGADSEVSVSLSAALAEHGYFRLELHAWSSGPFDPDTVTVAVDAMSTGCSMESAIGGAVWWCDLPKNASTVRITHKATTSAYGMSLVLEESDGSCTGTAGTCAE